MTLDLDTPLRGYSIERDVSVLVRDGDRADAVQRRQGERNILSLHRIDE